MLKGVLLDIDGTLIDSNPAHAKAWVDVLHEFGVHDVTVERVLPLVGMGGDKVVPMLLGVEHDSDLGKRVGERRSEIFDERYLPRLEAFPQARALLERMREDGLTLVVATSAEKEQMKKLLAVVGAEDLIEAKTSSGDAEQSKPDPDIIEVAIGRSGHDAGELVMLGDTPYDVEAARKAGVPTIALRCGGWGDEKLGDAVAIYDDPADLLANYDASPLGKGNGKGKGRSG